MTIDAFTVDDVKKVARLHHESLPDTLSSKLGVSYLEQLYGVIAQNPTLHTGFVVNEGDTILGVITLTADLQKTQQIIRRVLFPQVITTAMEGLVLGRITLGDIMSLIQLERVLLKEQTHPYVTILTVCVSASARRRGIGKALVRRMFTQLKKEGVTCVFVDTQKVNLSAQSFYRAMGFYVEKEVADSLVLVKKL